MSCKCWWQAIHVWFDNFRKNERNEAKILLRKSKSLIKIFAEARAKLKNNQLKKVKSRVKNKTGTKLTTLSR